MKLKNRAKKIPEPSHLKFHNILQMKKKQCLKTSDLIGSNLTLFFEPQKSWNDDFDDDMHLKAIHSKSSKILQYNVNRLNWPTHLFFSNNIAFLDRRFTTHLANVNRFIVNYLPCLHKLIHKCRAHWNEDLKKIAIRRENYCY